MIYVLFVISLTLAGLAGYEFFYLSYLDAQNRQQRRRIAELEREATQQRASLKFTQSRLEEMAALNEESWPELVDDERPR